MEKKEYLFERKLRKNGGTSIAHFRKAQGYYIRITITGTILDKLGTKLDKQVAVADLVLSSFLFKLTSTNYLDSCRRYVLLSNLVTGTVQGFLGITY